MDLQIEQFKTIFFQECAELLATLEHELSSLRSDCSNPEPLHAAFRAIHSIKGGAGMLGFGRLVDLAHTVESALRVMRSGAIEIDDKVVDAVIHASDAVADLIQAARLGVELEQAYEADAAERLAVILGNDHHDESPVSVAFGLDDSLVANTGNFAGCELRSDEPERQSPARSHRHVYRIRFRPKPGMLKRSNEPLLILRHLRELGSLTVEADLSRLPEFAELVPTDAYLAWNLKLETDVEPAVITEAFEFVEGDCELTVEHTEIPDPQVADPEIGSDPATPAPEATNPASIEVIARAAARGQGASSIRVDIERIDRLVNLVGEIAISQAMIQQNFDQSMATSNPGLFNDLSQLLKLTRSLHDSVMAIRAQPIRTIFARMPRVVRDLVNQTGKKVRLETSGEETEIDKTLVEQLGDPLMHLIRNAVDHGIEPVEQRLAKGKAEEGTVRISAAQRGGQIVIEVSDDGGGIDRDKVRRKAIELGLLPDDAKLNEDEINSLIFAPGLSTAANVTSISGRGVGMDVVKSNLQKLGGRISIASEQGKGSTLTLTLPLTLAVMDGMIVGVGREQYVIPIASIIECLAVSRQQFKSVPGSGEILYTRGAPVRVVRLAALPDDSASAVKHQLAILVEADAGETIALVVDEIVGQQQVVIKSLRENFEQPPGIAGATILGNGAVALLLDVAAISRMSAARGRRHFHSSRLHADTERQVA